MFSIKIADIPIGIENRYRYVRELCREFETEEVPAFTVSASEDEILEEQNGEKHFSKGYCESLRIYRKICCRLARYDAFLMHSAVIAVDGEAYVFAAPSGTGKTTHIRLWLEAFGDRARVINGDKPVFRFMDGVLYACGTPWQGKERLGCNEVCPVQAVCFLEQSAENKIRRLNAEEVNGRIFHQILIPREEEDFVHFWPLLEKLVTTNVFYLLECNRKPEAARMAYYRMRRNDHAEN